MYLTNFYYNGLPNNKLLFVEALRRLLNLPAIKYAAAEPPLPIYRNNDGIKCHTERHWKHKGVIKAPCPHCDRKVPLNRLLHEVDNNTHRIGCSEDCLGQGGGYVCYNCDERFSQTITGPDNNEYCESCHDDLIRWCDGCNQSVWNDDYLGNGYCTECGDTCHECGMTYHREDMRSDDAGDSFCQRCYDDKYTRCDECDTELYRDDAREGEDGSTLCERCYEREEREREREAEEENKEVATA